MNRLSSKASAPTILIATLLHAEGQTGVQTHFNTLGRWLAREKIPFELATPFHASLVWVYPVFAVRRVIDWLSKPWSVWWYRHWHEYFLYAALKRRLRTIPLVTVYAQCPLAARAALRARRDARQKVVLVVHFNVSQAEEWRGKGYLQEHDWMYRRVVADESAVLPRLDGIVYVSNFMRDTIQRKIPDAEKVPSAVIPNFCDPIVLNEGSANVDAKSDLARADIINIGSLEPRKNQRFLLQVVAQAKRRGEVVRLLLVGDGPDHAALHTLATELGIVDQVQFVGYQANARRWLASARVYVHSAAAENLPIAVMEAMAQGLPVIAPEVGGIPDLLQDNVQGRYWPLSDVQNATSILLDVLNDKTQQERYSTNAKATFEQRFRTDRVGAAWLQFIATINGWDDALRRAA